MKDKLYYFTIGFMLSTLVSIVIISAIPTPEATWCDKMDEVCANCGMKAWYFKNAEDLAEGDN